MRKKKFISKGVAGLLAAAMMTTMIPMSLFAANATDGQMTDAAKNNKPLSDTQSIVYNTATLFNYSDTFYHSNEKKVLNLISGKGDYNADTMDIAYAQNPDAEKWEGLYFSSGGNSAVPYSIDTYVPRNVAKDFTIGAMSSNSASTGVANALWDGDTSTKAWATNPSFNSTTGYIQLNASEAKGIKTVKLYFMTESSWLLTSMYPTSVTVYNGAYSDESKVQLTTVQPSFKNGSITNEISYDELTIDLGETVSTNCLTIEFGYDNWSYIILNEIEFYNDTDMETSTQTISKELADYNKWSGQNKRPKSSFVYSGLVKSTLLNGQIQFNVPQAGVFDTNNTSNKEVYTNIGLPFIYDFSTGYYTFDAGTEGYGVHFNDSNDNNVIDADEKKDNVNLVLDYPFTGIDDINGNNEAGFYPFNCSGGNSRDAIYHFGMNTVIDFTMTADGTVDGNGGEPITFEFAGDDDVWVFIDGQLVLDLGGIHDSVSAKIDFKENKISMWSTNTAKGSGDLATGTGSTNAGYITDLGAILNKTTGNDVVTGAISKSYETFAGEGEHKLAIFYLERGRGESNCKIKYNLPRQDAFEVSKNIQLATNETQAITDEEWSALNALTFKMRVLNSEEKPVTGKYALYNSSQYIGIYTTDSEGYFTLKNNQKARFVGTLGSKYTVEEYADESALPSAIWKTAAWSGTLTAAKVTNLTGATSTNDSTTTKLTYNVNNLQVRDNESDTLVINCTNYISRPFVSVSGETIVIDYGLPVKIDIMANDVQSSGKEFIINGLSTPSYGTVKVVDKDGVEVEKETYTKTAGYYYLEYTPNTYMSNIEKVTYTYKVLSDTLNGTGSYDYPTGVATIIPATTMYYEENFLNSTGVNYIKFSTANGFTGFTPEGTADKTYQEPGVVGTTNDSTYGTDAAYLTGTGDSNGTSYQADTTNGPAAFQYTFTGTGTAFFARTSEKSGYLRVSVKDSMGNSMITNAAGNRVDYCYIDTKYAKDAETNAYNVTLPLYNIPVFNMNDLPYGTYTVTVTIAQPSQWYKTQNEFYLDGVRVYNPLNMDMSDGNKADYYEEVYEAYERDLETDTNILTLRDYMLETQTKDPESEESEWTEDSQVMFTDTNGELKTASEYKSNGPKQELYMTSGQAIRFVLKDWFSDKPTDARLYIGAKVPEGKTGVFKVNGKSYTIRNTTDCYYDITSTISPILSSHDGSCVITVDSSLISFTNLKCVGFPNFSLAGMNRYIDGSEGNDEDVDGEITVFSFLMRTVEESTSGNDSDNTNTDNSGTDSSDTDNTDTDKTDEGSTDTGNTDKGDTDIDDNDTDNTGTDNIGTPSDDNSSDNEGWTLQNIIEKIVSTVKSIWNKLFH